MNNVSDSNPTWESPPVSDGNTTWESPPDMTAEFSQPSDGVSWKKVGPIAVSVAGIIVILLFVFVSLYRRIKRNNRPSVVPPRRQPPRRQTHDDKQQHIRQPAINRPMLQSSVARVPSSSSGSAHPSLRTFSYEELRQASGDFSNFLGEGGYGDVYKGVLADGKSVAIKRRKSESKQGEREFKAEVETCRRVHHENLVSLVGYCSSEEHKILVYEFVPNGTLHLHLHGTKKPTLDWPTRMKIAQGFANGLAYLHEECHPQIIHRDVKTSNILLDDKFVAKVADFGLAKFTSDTKSYVSTDVKGTQGYLDPEYCKSQKLTDKADIFSFGVVLLELITGQVPMDKSKLLHERTQPSVKQALEDGNFDALIDQSLQNKYDPSEMRRMVVCAAACVQNSASNRPKMSQIVRALEGNLPLEDLYGGIKPGDSGEGSKSYDTNQRNEDLKKYHKLLQEDHKEDTNEQSKRSTIYVTASERLHVEGEHSGQGHAE